MAIPQITTVYGNIIPSRSKPAVISKIDKDIGIGYSSSGVGKGYYFKLSGGNLIKENLKQLIRTQRGERFMLPDYGCNLKKYLMEPLDETTFNSIKSEILESINKYLSKISVDKLQVFETETSQLLVTLFCSEKSVRMNSFDTSIKV